MQPSTEQLPGGREILETLLRVGPQSIEQLHRAWFGKLRDGELSRALDALVQIGQIIIWQVDATVYTVMLRHQTMHGHSQVRCRL